MDYVYTSNQALRTVIGLVWPTLAWPSLVTIFTSPWYRVCTIHIWELDIKSMTHVLETSAIRFPYVSFSWEISGEEKNEYISDMI